MAGSYVSSTLTSISNHLKPHRTEALQRLRSNGVGLIATLVLSYLLPVPSFIRAIGAVLTRNHAEPFSLSWWCHWFCLLELAAVAIFTYNVAEAAYAIKYPRPPFPPITSPKPKSVVGSTPTPKRPFKILSPNSSPQPQKPFAFSPSASFTSASKGLSNSVSSATYVQSPISTPSRVLHYSIPPSSSTNTNASSTSTAEYLATPSPVVSAYRGKRAAADVGRALDGSYLSRIAADDDDSFVEE